MEEHEVRLVLESDGWHTYVDGVEPVGSLLSAKDRVIAKIEVMGRAKRLSPCKFLIIDACGSILYQEIL